MVVDGGYSIATMDALVGCCLVSLHEKSHVVGQAAARSLQHLRFEGQWRSLGTTDLVSSSEQKVADCDTCYSTCHRDLVVAVFFRCLLRRSLPYVRAACTWRGAPLATHFVDSFPPPGVSPVCVDARQRGLSHCHDAVWLWFAFLCSRFCCVTQVVTRCTWWSFGHQVRFGRGSRRRTE